MALIVQRLEEAQSGGWAGLVPSFPQVLEIPICIFVVNNIVRAHDDFAHRLGFAAQDFLNCLPLLLRPSRRERFQLYPRFGYPCAGDATLEIR